MKEFLMLVREEATYGEISLEEMQKCVEKHIRWVAELTEKGHYKGANPLDAGGAYVQGTEKIVTDGPFIESKECVSGYYILTANSLEEAIEVVKGCPDLEWGRTLEVREITQIEG